MLTKVAGLLALSIATVASGENWTRYGGPGGLAKSVESINLDWEAKPPEILWRRDVGPGFGGMSIHGNRGYFLDRVDATFDVVRCVDMDTGEEIWSHENEVPGRLSYNGSRSTPTIAGERVFVVGAFGDVYCLDAMTGDVVWTKHMVDDFGSEPPNWGYSQSPLLHNGLVIIAPMSKTGLVAMREENGEVVWKSTQVGGDSYTSPSLEIIGGVEQILFYAKSSNFDENSQAPDPKTGLLSSVDPKSGALLWSYDGYFNKIPIPKPIVIDGRTVVLGGGYDCGTVVLEISKKGKSWSASERARMDVQGSQIQPFIYHENHVFANFNTNTNLKKEETEEGLTCFDLDGNIKWQLRTNPRIDRGAVLKVEDALLALGGQTGVLHLMDVSPKGAEELGSFALFDKLQRRDNNIWGPLGLSNGKLVARSMNQLVCVDVSP